MNITRIRPQSFYVPLVFGRSEGSHSSRRLRITIAISVVSTCLLLGLLASQPARVPYGPYLLAFLLVILVAGFVFVDRLFPVFAGWVAIEGIAYPFLRYPLHHDVATFDRFVILGLGVSILLHPWRPMATVSRRATWAFSVFTLIYGASTIFELLHPLPLAPTQHSSSPIQPGIDWIENLLLPLIVFVIAARTVSYERWRTLAKALTFLGTSLAVLTLVTWQIGFNLSHFAGSQLFLVSDVTGLAARATGPYASPTAYGAVLIVCIAATLYLIQVDKAYFWGGIAFAFEVISLAPGLTKTVWSAAFVAIIVALGVRRRVTSRILMIGLPAVLILAIAYSVFGSSKLVTARTTSTASAESFAAREGAWQQALSIFDRWPLFGVGTGQVINAQALVRPVRINGVPAASSAHNTELSVLAETGLIGALGLIVISYAMVQLIRTWRRQAQTAEEVIFGSTVLAAVTGYVILSQTFGEIHDPPSSIFCALILGAVAGRLNYKTRLRQIDLSLSEITVVNQQQTV
jgi:O-antigen ligase